MSPVANIVAFRDATFRLAVAMVKQEVPMEHFVS